MVGKLLGPKFRLQPRTNIHVHFTSPRHGSSGFISDWADHCYRVCRWLCWCIHGLTDRRLLWTKNGNVCGCKSDPGWRSHPNCSPEFSDVYCGSVFYWIRPELYLCFRSIPVIRTGASENAWHHNVFGIESIVLYLLVFRICVFLSLILTHFSLMCFGTPDRLLLHGQHLALAT